MDAWYQVFPDVAVVSVVRPNWNLEKIIGSNLSVSHHLLAFKRDGVVMVRHSTTEHEGAVVELSLQDYMHQFVDSPTIKGINIYKTKPYPLVVNG